MTHFQDQQKHFKTTPPLPSPPHPHSSKYLLAYSTKQSCFMQASTRNQRHHLFLKQDSKKARGD